MRAVIIAVALLCADTGALALQFERAETQSLEVTISRVQDRDAISVKMAFDGDPSGQTTLRFTNWAELPGRGNHVDKLTAHGVLDKLYVDREADGEWSIRHRRNEPLVITYEVPENTRQASNNNRDHHRPIYNESLLHAVGHVFLALPQHLGDNVELTLAWDGFGDWMTLTSLGSLDKTVTMTTSTQDLYGALFVAGPLRIEERYVNGNPIYISLHGEHWDFTLEELADNVATIAQVERDYFDDHAFPFYWVSAIAVGEALESGYSYAGTRLHNSFALFLNPSTRFESSELTGSPIMRLLAHEMMHVWFGGKLLPSLEADEGTYFWFSEGFTDYFTNLVMLESGLLTDLQYVNVVNDVFRDYYYNPQRDAPNQAIPGNFYQSMNYRELPYQRGKLIALALELGIVTRSLKDIMADWLRDDSWSEGFTLDDFLDALDPELSDSQLEALTDAIEQGGDIDWSLFNDGHCLEVFETDVFPWEVGFDYITSFETATVSGVIRGSAAYWAGLRNGQELLAWSLKYDNIDEPVKLRVAEIDEEIEFFARGTPARMPQVRLRAPDCL